MLKLLIPQIPAVLVNLNKDERNQVERDGAGRFGRRGRGDATAASTSTAPRVWAPNAELKWGEGAAQQCVAPAACGVSSSDDCCVEDRRRAMLLRRAAGERQPLARLAESTFTEGDL